MSSALAWLLAGAATVAIASLASFLLRRRNRRRAAVDQTYEEWLEQTTRLLTYGDSDVAKSGVQIYLGPTIRVLDAQSQWARRAVEQGHLAWAHGTQFVKLVEPADDDDGLRPGWRSGPAGRS